MLTRRNYVKQERIRYNQDSHYTINCKRLREK